MLYLSSACWNGNDFSEFMDAALKAGITNVELSGGFDSAPGSAEELAAYREKGFSFMVHNYYPPPQDGHFILNIASTDAPLRRKSVAFAKRAMDLAAALGSGVYTIHAGYLARLTLAQDGEHFSLLDNELPDRNLALHALGRSVEELSKHGRERGVALALENQFPPQGGPNHSLFCDPDEIVHFLNKHDRLNSLGILLDIAHATISANLIGFDLDRCVETLLSTDRVVGLHISGNGGVSDDHTLPDLNGQMVRILQESYARAGWATLETRNQPFELVADHFLQLKAMLDQEAP